MAKTIVVEHTAQSARVQGNAPHPQGRRAPSRATAVNFSMRKFRKRRFSPLRNATHCEVGERRLLSELPHF